MNKASVLSAVFLLALGGAATAQSLQPGSAASNPFAGSPRLEADNPNRGADHIVAVVNSEPITNSEVRARLARIEAPAGTTLPPRAELARQVLERLILEKAQVQWAAEIGVKVDDAAVTQAEETVALQNRMTLAQLHARLGSVGLTQEAFRANLRNELLLQRVREREVDNRVKISEQDIDVYLQEQLTKAGNGQVLLNLAQVMIPVPENASADVQASLQARAAQVAQRARSGEDFAALAREFSQSPEGKQGGQLGIRPADRYPNLFTDAVRGLKVGGVTGPLRSGAGWHVLQVVEKRNPNLPDATYTQTRVRHILLRPTAQLSQDAAIAQLDKLRQRIQAGEVRFEDAAREVSVDGSARQGGDLGWANPGQFVPEFEQAMNSLPPQKVSDPLVSRFGVHLIQVQERRQAELSVRDQREMVRNVLREQKAEQAYQEWSQDVRDRAFVEYREPPR
ncbi:MAG TPA: peptidylprolyl isomerase [Macromonas sp.]|nr:peptidylprolyl isomerase [Macromonas sp.]